MKRKDFAKYGSREGVVLDVLENGSIVWQDMTVMIVDGRPATNHALVLQESDLKRAGAGGNKKYTYMTIDVEVTRITERAIGILVDGIKLYAPKSLVNMEAGVPEEGETGQVQVADWWFPKALKEKEDEFLAGQPKGGRNDTFDAPPVAVPDDGIPF